MTRVQGQMGPQFMITNMEALKAILEKDGAQNLIGELYRLIRQRPVGDTADLFDIRTAGMVFGPAAVVRDMAQVVKWGVAENHTYHFAVTAIRYAMALERLDPDFFKDQKHAMPSDHDGFEQLRQEIMQYVRELEKKE